MITVVPRGESPLPEHAHHPGRHEAGSARGQGDCGETEGEEVVSPHLPPGPCYGQGDWLGQVSGMLRLNAERSEDSVRRGHSSGVVPETQAKKEEVQGSLKTAHRCQHVTS